MDVDKQYRLLDVVKLLLSVMVIAFHTFPKLPSGSNAWYSGLGTLFSLRVPFFFMASGFLLFRKIVLPLDGEGELRIKRFLKKTIKLYLIWTIIYLPLSIFGFFQDGTPFLKAVMIFIRNVIVVGENFFSWPLWYLLGLVYAVSIIWMLLKLRIPKGTILVLSVVAAILGVVLDYCHENGMLEIITHPYYSVFVNTRNGFFFGFLYVALGLIYSASRRNSLAIEIICGVLGIIGMILNIPLANAFAVYALFGFVLRPEGKMIKQEHAQFCRSLSTIVYLIHMYIVALLIFIFNVEYGFSLFVITALVSVITGAVMLIKCNRIVDVIFKG